MKISLPLKMTQYLNNIENIYKSVKIAGFFIK